MSEIGPPADQPVRGCSCSCSCSWRHMHATPCGVRRSSWMTSRPARADLGHRAMEAGLVVLHATGTSAPRWPARSSHQPTKPRRPPSRAWTEHSGAMRREQRGLPTSRGEKKYANPTSRNLLPGNLPRARGIPHPAGPRIDRAASGSVARNSPGAPADARIADAGGEVFALGP